MSLRKKTLLGVFWTILDSFVLKGLSFISTIVLARLLGPAEFGLVGMISVFVAVGISITDSGMSASIIRMKKPSTLDYSTVFFLNLFLSIGFYLLIFCLAPIIADFYNQSILTLLLRVYCLSFVITAFSAVQLAILNAKMEFKKIMQQNVVGTVVGVLVGLGLGYLGYGVWSIVLMYLTTQLVQTIVLWLGSSWKPAIVFSKEKAKYHFEFGYKLMLAGLLNTVFLNIYNVIIGKVYSVKELGYFERSKSFNEYPITVLTTVLTKVSYPMLATLQENKQQISSIYRKVMQISFFITCFLMCTAGALAYPLFDIILGEEWRAAVPFFQILCLSSVFYPIHAFNLNVFKVYGKSEIFLKLEIIKKIIVTIGLVIGFQYGIFGLVWSSVITNFLALFVNGYYTNSLIDYSIKKQLKDMFPTALTAGIVFAVVNYFTNSHFFNSSFHLVVIGVSISFVLYISLNVLMNSEPLLYGIKIIKEKTIKI